MKNKALGCLTPSGIASGLLTLALVLAISSLRGNRMFSPGELNAQASELRLGGVSSHAELAARCGACHTAPWDRQGMSDLCLECHTDLSTDPQNFHRVMLAQGKSSACYDCHTDHNGRTASMTVLDLTEFPHLSVGYSLEAHRTTTLGTDFTCRDCHTASLAQFDQRVCIDCHDPIRPGFIPTHVDDFGADCLACHDGVDRYGGAFDHNRTAYSLEGKHALAACSGCHAGARSSADLQAAPHDCAACHAGDDPHQGSYGTACEGCHTPEDWQKATFDHSRSAFPLTGKRTDVACEQCHVDRVFKGAPQDCAACHLKDDAHQGQFGADCGGCHTPESWEQAQFDHSRAAFKLEGAHTNVPCDQCHINGVFKGTPLQCEACHQEPPVHAGLFPGDCARCHTVNAWTPAQFDQPHTFPINHGEGGLSACKTCHPTDLLTYSCYGCHEHNEAEIAAKHREEGISDFADCMRCHPTGREEEGGGRGGDD